MVVYRNQTYDDDDASFRYGGAYWHVEYWNVSTAVAGGKYHFSNAADAIVTFVSSPFLAKHTFVQFLPAIPGSCYCFSLLWSPSTG